MDHEDNIDVFVHKLQNRKGASFSVYRESGSNSKDYDELRVGDVLKTISKQIMTIKNSDRLNQDVRKNITLSSHKKCGFIPLASIQAETCSMDTQLIDFVRKAEAMIQEENDREKNKLTSPRDVASEKERIVLMDNTKQYMPEQHKVLNITEERQCGGKINDKCCEVGNKEDSNDITDLHNKSNSGDKLEAPTSPILSSSRSTSKPLVCMLEEFDNFEKLAVPVLRKFTDFNEAKRAIHTQVKAKNFAIQSHSESVKYDRDKGIQNVLGATRNAVNQADDCMQVGDDIRTQYSFDVKVTNEDKMLFDSDDEIDVLPLTCALETYDEPGLLDKTLYVGFQTASNRSIQILADSFNKARCIFDDVSRKVADKSVTELVQDIDRKCPDGCHSTVNIKDKYRLNNLRDTSDNPRGIVEEFCKKEDIIEIVDEKSVACGTAHNNAEYIDEQLIKEFDVSVVCDSDVFDNKKIVSDTQNSDKMCIESGLKNDENDVINISSEEHNIAHTKSSSTKCRGLLIENRETKVNNFVGFRTASDKKIAVSDEAVIKTRNVFDNIDDLELSGYRSTKECNEPKSVEKFTKNKPNLHNSKNTEVTKDVFRNNKSIDTERFRGFRTASNKNVYISKSALEKSKKIFEDIGENEDGFRTDDTKKHDEDMERNKMFNKIAPSDNGYKTQTTMQGFITASKKPVTISEEALSRCKKIFHDISYGDGIQNTSYSQDNKVQNICKVKSDNITIEKVEHRLKRKESLSKSETIENSSVVGIQNANNLKISKDEGMRSKISDNINYKNKENLCIQTSFVGFQTASNKKVKISEEALIKSKELFRSLDEDGDHTATKKFKVNEGFIGFQTANKKPVKVSEEALAKSKKIFEDIDLNKAESGFDPNVLISNKQAKISEAGFESGEKPQSCDQELKNHIKSKLKTNSIIKNNPKDTKDNKPNDKDKDITQFELNIDDLLNTEVIKNFDESLHMEEIVKDTPKSKRSGSPILSCPRAKKKKFEPPRSINRNIINNVEVPKTTHSYKFRDSYKRTKIYKLKDLKKNRITSRDIDIYILKYSFDNLLEFRFRDQRNDIDSDVWGTDKIKEYFTDNVNIKIVPEGWVENHMRLIIWKLLCYETFFGESMRNVCSVKNVLEQLKYRYDKELYNVERPALRRILERDDLSTKMMVLCVASIHEAGVSVRSVTNDSKNVELLLTDGWYCLKACVDRMIEKLIVDRKIVVGMKLAIHGAELLNCDQGMSPWEDINSVRLKLSGNSTKRARWDARLGFHGNAAMLTPLSAARLDGGKVSKLRVFVTRVYPTLYVEKFEDGSTVTRSERLELLHQMKYEAEKQMQMEKLYEEVEKMIETESQDSEQLTQNYNLETGSQIAKLMMKNQDPSELKATLTSSQVQRLNEHTHRQKEALIQKIQDKVKDLMKKRGINVSRSVVPLMKIRVADLRDDVTTALITIWRPNESLHEVIREGAWIDVYNAVPTSIRYSEIQISAGRQSMFCKSKYKETDRETILKHTLERKCYNIKDLQSSKTSPYNEIDTFGAIFLIEPENFDSNKQLFQNIYISGINKDIISINFWGGIKKFGYENILNVGNVVACVNIQKRAGNTKSIPQYRATELSYFTKTPKYDSLKTYLTDFLKKYNKMDGVKFVRDCVALKNNYSNINNDVSPLRHCSELNLSRNKMFLDSPLTRNSNLNITGSALEPGSSEETMLRKKKESERRIDKLKKYGEPPPLNQIHIRNRAHITPYKSPLISNDVSIRVANIDNDVASNKISSPVLNKTFVKINPVKLNFNVDNNEEPESPPLSLDTS
ncbi:breast cancer type 2 susceptibility protein homolog isoform X2 [Danaus plexippus]|uniref:breast cancer type 2 susceptibility protein homolog isoform X2 n=1 Tax=Danaus plexippus TaxID=13037 RepID=UPI002AB1D5CB|nr:breast cancer type 2 susceptibility protein homolog isoform X2 [Danaus plexippus]